MYKTIVNLTANHAVTILSAKGIEQDPVSKQFVSDPSNIEILKVVEPSGYVPRVYYKEDTEQENVAGEIISIESLKVLKIDEIRDYSEETLYIVSGQYAAAANKHNVVAPSKLVRNKYDLKVVLGCISFRRS